MGKSYIYDIISNYVSSMKGPNGAKLTSVLQTKAYNKHNIAPSDLKFNFKNLDKDVVEINPRTHRPQQNGFFFKVSDQAGVGETQLIAYDVNNNELGNIVYSFNSGRNKSCYDFPDSYLDANGNLLPHLHIDSLYSNQTKKGTGTSLLKKAVEESIELGCEGRIILDAGAKGFDRSPIPFYFKNFFHCCNQNNDNVFRKIPTKRLDELNKLSILEGGLPPVRMYLPIENVNALLKKEI